MKKKSKKELLMAGGLALEILVVLLFLALSYMTGSMLSTYQNKVLMTVGINIILAVSLNVATGYLGQLPLGHAGFMAVGAYTCALFTKYSPLPDGVSFAIGLALGAVMAGLFGVLIGVPALRLTGDYLAILTLGFGEIIRITLNNIDDVLGYSLFYGSKGLKNIPKYSNFANVFLCVVITCFLIHAMMKSRHGRAVLAIRDNEIAAESCGIQTTYYKVMAFAFSAAFAGLAGGLYAVYSVAIMLMMIQCAQASRDRGINPVFIYGFFGGVAYIMQSAGFLLGWVSDFMWIGGREWLFIVAMVSSYVLGLTLLAATGTLFKSLAAKGTVTADPIEFLAVGAPEEPRQQKAAKPAAKRRRNRPSASEDAGVIRDRTSKQCLMLQEAHGLSTRETEVMELIARGNSMAAIAERLVISENTVRTHAKHIYTKLDIHRRQELLDMLHE